MHAAVKPHLFFPRDHFLRTIRFSRYRKGPDPSTVHLRRLNSRMRSHRKKPCEKRATSPCVSHNSSSLSAACFTRRRVSEKDSSPRMKPIHHPRRERARRAIGGSFRDGFRKRGSGTSRKTGSTGIDSRGRRVRNPAVSSALGKGDEITKHPGNSPG